MCSFPLDFPPYRSVCFLICANEITLVIVTPALKLPSHLARKFAKGAPKADHCIGGLRVAWYCQLKCLVTNSIKGLEKGCLSLIEAMIPSMYLMPTERPVSAL